MLRGGDVLVRYEDFNNWKMTMSRSSKWDSNVETRPKKAQTKRVPLACAKNKVNIMEQLEEGEEIYVR